MKEAKPNTLLSLVSEKTLSRINSEFREELKELLNSSTIPRYAFIAVNVPKYTSQLTADGYKRRIKMSFCIINLENQPDRKTHLEGLCRQRGLTLLCYGNFPTKDSTDEVRKKKYDDYTVDGRNPWDMMERECKHYLSDEKVSIEEHRGLAKELEEARAKLEEYEKEQNDKESIEHNNSSKQSGSGSSNKGSDNTSQSDDRDGSKARNSDGKGHDSAKKGSIGSELPASGKAANDKG